MNGLQLAPHVGFEPIHNPLESRWTSTKLQASVLMPTCQFFTGSTVLLLAVPLCAIDNV